MKKSLTGVLIFFISLMLSCKGDSDILATYKGGQIIRSDFNEWIESNHFAKKSIMRSKKKQKNKLRKMIIERVTIEKAKAENFDKSEEFSAMKERITESQLMSILYRKEIKENAKFNEPAVKVRHMLFRTRDHRVEKGKSQKVDSINFKKELDSKMAKAREVIEKLDSGESFEELAKKHSDDFSKRKGGDIGYIVNDMMPPEYSKIAFSLEEGEYTKTPVNLAKGIYIIKVENKVDLTEKNIEEIIEDKSQAKRLMARLQRRHAKDYIDKLTRVDDVEEHFDNAASKNKNDVIFKVGDKVFTVQDLAKRINLTMGKRMMGRKGLPKITDEQKKGLARNVFKFEILKRVAIDKGIDKDPEYTKNVNSKLNSALAREYTKSLGSTDIKVSKDELLEEYNKNKDKRYYKMVKKNKKRVRVVEPFRKVKDKIERILINKKRRDYMKKWKEDILKEFEFNVVESRLEGE